MLDVLTKAEIEQVRAFRLTTEEKLSDLSIPVNELLDETILFNRAFV